MSECGCGQPVIISGTQAPARVDVEPVLLCDVLPDGTVAGPVLVEPVYDTNSGARVATRLVDPATGATYTPTGTVGPCAPEGCARQVTQTVRCDDTDGDGTGDLTYVELWAVDPCNGGAPESLGAFRDGDLAQPYTPVSPVACPEPPDCPTCVSHVLCDVQPVTSAIGPMPPNPANGGTLPNGVTWRSNAPDTLLFGNDRWRADSAPATFTFSELITLDWAVAFSGPGTTTVVIPPGNSLVALSAGHAWDPATRRLSATASTVDANQVTTFRAANVTSWLAPALFGAVGGAFAYYGDMQVTADVSHTFLRRICRDCSGAAVSLTDTELDGTTPYTPAGTVGVCGPVEADRQRYDGEVVELCDVAADGTATAFLRHLRYGTLDGIVYSSRDTTLDGITTYTPAGTVGRCPTTTACASPTEPTATVGLCLPDGTPIAVTVVRDCDGVVTQEGWINLTTGAFSAGAPPAGTGACGDSQSVQVSGTFCDVLPDGRVAGLVLIEYSYTADGTIASVRLVDAVTGATYTPTGTVTTCPVGVEQPEQDVVQLCDIAADGAPTPFVRDFRRDETGTITGHSDYTLDGAAYTPTGTVGLCTTPEPERDLTVLCDNMAGGVVQFLRDYERDATGAIVGHADYTLAGAAYTPTGTVGVCDASAEEIDHLQQVLCDTAADGSVTQFLRHWTVDNTSGALTAAGDTALDGTTAYTPAGAVGACQPCTRQIVERCACDDTNADGIAEVSYIEVWAIDPCNGTAPVKLGTFLDGDYAQPYTPVSPVECDAGVTLERNYDVEQELLCLKNADGSPYTARPQALLHTVYDATTGDIVRSYYTDLSGALFTLPAGIVVIACGDTTRLDQRVLTGSWSTDGTTATTRRDFQVEYPGLQSITVIQLAGTSLVGTNVGTSFLPAGASATWSVADTDDSVITPFSLQGADASARVFVAFTYKATAQG